MMWNLDSYPTTVLNERMTVNGVKTYYDPFYIFSGCQDPLNPQDLHPCRQILMNGCQHSFTVGLGIFDHKLPIFGLLAQFSDTLIRIFEHVLFD